MKKKILLLSDDIRAHSGVSTMSKEIILGTVHKYDWIQLGSLSNHPDINKIIDVSTDVKNITGINDSNVKIYPSNGYGDIDKLRSILYSENPDAIIHFTDPHYWLWLYSNEYEIRKQVPLLYYHVWDNLPIPKWNEKYYESCDWIGCISKLTYGIVKNLMSEKLNENQISYVPHGVNENIFKPLNEIDEEVKNIIFEGKEYEFIIFFNNRNIKRKLPINVIESFKLFCDELPEEKSSKCLLLMNTDHIDEYGTNLVTVVNDLCPKYDVKFIENKVTQEDLNNLYNLSDCTINLSSNEGFGLSTLESLMSGTPIIVNVTGGLQDQCGFNYSENDYINIGTLSNKSKYNDLEHGSWSFPIWSSSNSLTGSLLTPYIYEDFININDVKNKLKEIYNLSKEERKKIGLEGREYCLKHFTSKLMCEKIIEGLDYNIENHNKKNKYKLISIK